MMTKRSPRHGRALATAGFGLYAVLFGSLWSFPALSNRMAPDFGGARSVLQGAFAIHLLLAAAFGPMVGRFVDRRGPSGALPTAVILLTVAVCLVAVASSSWQVYLSLGMAAAPASAGIDVGITVAAADVEPSRRGRALGFAGAGIGVGIASIPTGAVIVATRVGWREAMLLVAACAFLVGLAAAVALRRLAPMVAPSSARDARIDGVWRSRAFVLLFAGGVAVGLFDEAVYQHLVPHVESIGYRPSLAALALALVSVGYLAGQITGGTVADQWGRRAAGMVAAALAVAGLLGIAMAGRLPESWLWVASAGFGLGLGATLAVRRVTLVDLFAGPRLGVAAGYNQWSWALGGSAIAWLGAKVDEAVGTYAPVFVVAIGAVALWVACLHGALAVGRSYRGAPT